MSTRESRQIAARAVMGISWHQDESAMHWVETGRWRLNESVPLIDQVESDMIARRITEYGERAAHAAAVEER